MVADLSAVGSSPSAVSPIRRGRVGFVAQAVLAVGREALGKAGYKLGELEHAFGLVLAGIEDIAGEVEVGNLVQGGEEVAEGVGFEVGAELGHRPRQLTLVLKYLQAP